MGSVVGDILEPFTGAKKIQEAANQAAAKQVEATTTAAKTAAFKPVGITTKFGTSTFGMEDKNGIPTVTSAGYTVSPELVAIQDALFKMTGGALTAADKAAIDASPLGQAAQNLFSLGSQYLAESPEELRNRFFQQQQELLAQPRQQEEERLASSVFGRGRAGLNIGAMGQPELAALANARRQQDLSLAAQAEQQAQQQLGYGASLFGTGASLLGQQYGLPTQALAPLQTYLGTIGAIEEMGQQPFKLGLSVGGAAQPGSSAAANLLGSGLSAAAQTQYQGVQQGNAANSAFLQGLLQSASGGFGGGGMPTMNFGGWGNPYNAAAGVNFTAPGVYG